MLALYGHPFSSYTWKAQIALYEAGLEHDFRVVDGDHPDHVALVQSAGPLGKFPVLADGDQLIFEATSIIEHVALHHAPDAGLIPTDRNDALVVRQYDRVFDNYVMTPMQAIVDEYLRDDCRPDVARIAEARDRLARTYAWLEDWLQAYRPIAFTLVECAAAPSLFYADWVHPIPQSHSRLLEYRAWLLARPSVSRCIEDARPFRAYFPPGAPDRD